MDDTAVDEVDILTAILREIALQTIDGFDEFGITRRPLLGGYQPIWLGLLALLVILEYDRIEQRDTIAA